MNYTSLVADKTTAGSIKRWVNDSTIDSETILTEAEALVYSMLRIREMRAATTLSMVVGDPVYLLPTGFLDPIGLWDITNNFKLTLRHEADLESRRTWTSGTLDSGTPYNFAIYAESLVFEVKYDAIATLRLLYFKTPTALSGSNLTNFLTTRYPFILRSACMAQAFNFMDDDREAKELTKLAAYIQRANAESDDSYRGLEVVNEVA